MNAQVVMAYLNKIFYNVPALAAENYWYLQSGQTACERKLERMEEVLTTNRRAPSPIQLISPRHTYQLQAVQDRISNLK
jgi:hypothetical protein